MSQEFINNVNSRILIIKLDENGQKFNAYVKSERSMNYITNSKLEDALINKDIIVVCTQNSLSGTDKHFQHFFKNYIKNKGYDMLSKVDATRQKNRSVLGSSYNVRTRIYYKKDNVIFDFNIESFKNSYNTKMNKRGTAFTNIRNNYKNIGNKSNKNKLYLTNYALNRFTDNQSINKGKISVGFRFLNPNPIKKGVTLNIDQNQFYFVVINNSNYSKNQTESNSNIDIFNKLGYDKTINKQIIPISKKATFSTISTENHSKKEININQNSNNRSNNIRVLSLKKNSVGNYAETTVVPTNNNGSIGNNVPNLQSNNTKFKLNINSIAMIDYIRSVIYQVFDVNMSNEFKLIELNNNNKNTKEKIEKNRRLLDVYLGMFLIIVVIKTEMSGNTKNGNMKYKNLLINIKNLIYDDKLINIYFNRKYISSRSMSKFDDRLLDILKFINGFRNKIKGHIQYKITNVNEFVSYVNKYDSTFGDYGNFNTTNRENYLKNILIKYQSYINSINQNKLYKVNEEETIKNKNLISSLLNLLKIYPKYEPKK